MKVYIKNKLLSLRGSSSVVDEEKNPVFSVKGKLISFTKKKRLYDKDGKLIYTIRNKFWFNWWTHYAYIDDANKNRVCKIQDKWFNVNNTYTIMGTSDEIQIVGKFMSLTCEIARNGEVIGTIRRKLDFFVDSFELEASEEDMPFCIALVIAIDNLVDKRRNSKR